MVLKRTRPDNHVQPDRRGLRRQVMKLTTIVCIVFLFTAAGITAEGAETHKLIPDSCITVVTVSNVQSDPGVSWLLDAWISSPRQSPLRELLKSTSSQEISIAVFPPKKDYPLYLLVVIKMSSGTGIDKEKLNAIITLEDDRAVKNISHEGIEIIAASGENIPKDFSAYAVIRDKALIGTDADILKTAITGPSIEGSPGYRKAKDWFSRADDGLLFADNSNSKFVNFLKPLEKKWKMTLLLSAEYLEWMGFSFDIVDSNRVAGEITFQGSPDADIEEIQDDAEFLGEAFKRKFMAEKIEYSSGVEVMDRTVRLKFLIEGIEPLWIGLFEKGALSIITPGEE